MLPFAGPAVIASIAYMDPGNFATNIQGGAQFGYLLLWVVVLANLVAMLFQALSAKVGIVTGQSLAGLCRRHFPRPVVLAMWVVSEIAAMATDLAESLGAAIGLSLLFGLPLLAGLLITFVATYAMLLLQGGGFRPIELVISVFIGAIGLCYLIELLIAPPDWGAFAFHSVVPLLAGPDSVTLAVGIIGATVMPHAIYLHSSLTQGRMPAANDADRRRILGYSNREVLLALGVAGLVNMAMLAMAARVFHEGHADVATIETAYHTLVPLLGIGAGAVFMVSLLASGFSSSVVGTMAGQVIMQDFVGFRIPLWLRRAGHHAAGPGDRRHRGGFDPGAGAQPGRAEPGAAGADDRAARAERAARRDGRLRQPARDAGVRHPGRRHGAGAQPGAALADRRHPGVCSRLRLNARVRDDRPADASPADAPRRVPLSTPPCRRPLGRARPCRHRHRRRCPPSQPRRAASARHARRSTARSARITSS